jgi:uncharacterized membrane protein HdeD (DUF308 family)
MGTSLLLAKLLGLTYLVVGVGILLNKSHYHSVILGVMRDHVLLYLGGVTSFIVGVVIVMFHNSWVADWTILITLVGWLATVKGVILIVSPKSMNDLAQFWLKRLQLAGIVCVCLGLLFGYYGFIA